MTHSRAIGLPNKLDLFRPGIRRKRSRSEERLSRRLVQQLNDKRSRRVIFLSHCLLNENTRYLGGACRGGCVREIVAQCIDAELGMVQMPCPEERAWGGVLKRYLLMTYGLRERHPWAYRLRYLLITAARAYTRLRYRRIAAQVASQIQDYVRSGFSVVGVVGVDGSPSCGVHTTVGVDALDALCALEPASFKVEKQNRLLREHAITGQGLFTQELQRALRRRGVSVQFLAHDLFAELGGQTPTLPLGKQGEGQSAAKPLSP